MTTQILPVAETAATQATLHEQLAPLASLPGYDLGQFETTEAANQDMPGSAYLVEIEGIYGQNPRISVATRLATDLHVGQSAGLRYVTYADRGGSQTILGPQPNGSGKARSATAMLNVADCEVVPFGPDVTAVIAPGSVNADADSEIKTVPTAQSIEDLSASLTEGHPVIYKSVRVLESADQLRELHLAVAASMGLSETEQLRYADGQMAECRVLNEVLARHAAETEARSLRNELGAHLSVADAVGRAATRAAADRTALLRLIGSKQGVRADIARSFLGLTPDVLRQYSVPAAAEEV
jgi:hypothetical protein